jgi:acyl-CoA thioester hydrolase
LQVFETSIVVQASDLDDLQHVNNVRYVQWVQDIAQAHWFKNATDDILSAYFWVLLSHHIDYKNPAFLGDTLTLKTYVSTSEGVTSTRHVEIFNSTTDQLLVTSTTKWCFLSKDTKRPTRITEAVKTLFD